HRGERVLLEETPVVPEPDEALVQPGDRVAPERRAHQLGGRIHDDGQDQREARGEPRERRPSSAPRAAAREGRWRRLRQRLLPAAIAFFCRRSRTCFGSPPGCTASPMFCWTSSLTLSHV